MIVNAKERARKQQDSSPPGQETDVWSPALDPKAAVRAQLVPLIRSEIERLKRQIAEVSENCLLSLGLRGLCEVVGNFRLPCIDGLVS